ncbi:(Fe-S)-binding protein [bacterium]|nr:(Fe-S)-binding protein [bacterium]
MTDTKTGSNREMMMSIGRMQARDGNSQSRLSWHDRNLKVAECGPIVYFVGCLPYADVLFGGHVETGLLEIPRAAVRLLNLLGIEPVVMPSEVCCGLDFHLTGDNETFESLARQNVEHIRKTGAKTILTTCGDGAFMLRKYPSLGFDHGCEVMHVAEFAANRLDEIKIPEGTGILPSCTTGPCGDSGPINTSALSKLLGKGVVDLSQAIGGPFECAAGGWLPANSDESRKLEGFIAAAVEMNCDRIYTACPRMLLSLRYTMRPGAWHRSSVELQDLTVALARLWEARQR